MAGTGYHMVARKKGHVPDFQAHAPSPPFLTSEQVTWLGDSVLWQLTILKLGDDEPGMATSVESELIYEACASVPYIDALLVAR